LCPDPLFCDGEDICLPGDPDADDDGCVGPGDPCFPLVCNENADTCDDCTANADCDDGVDCTVDTCNGATGECTNTPDNGLCPGPGDPGGAIVCDPIDGCIVP
jgi:hypothetical protein